MSDPDIRFVDCRLCLGAGKLVVASATSRWQDPATAEHEETCDHCDGNGVVEIEVQPVEMNDLDNIGGK